MIIIAAAFQTDRQKQIEIQFLRIMRPAVEADLYSGLKPGIVRDDLNLLRFTQTQRKLAPTGLNYHVMGRRGDGGPSHGSSLDRHPKISFVENYPPFFAGDDPGSVLL